MTYSPNFRGNVAIIGARQLQSTYVNGSGIELVKGVPVIANAVGTLEVIDVSDAESVSRFVGINGATLPIAASGLVYGGGRVEDIVIGYSLGTALYVSKAGFLTDTKPNIGVDGFVAGDWVIFVGVIVKNEFDVLKKDIQLMLSVVGQL